MIVRRVHESHSINSRPKTRSVCHVVLLWAWDKSLTESFYLATTSRGGGGEMKYPPRVFIQSLIEEAVNNDDQLRYSLGHRRGLFIKT